MEKAVTAMRKIVIVPTSVCCDRILVSVNEDNIIKEVHFDGGCDGNGKALARLLTDMPVSRAADLLKGVECDGKGTSCADQLALGLTKELARDEKA